MKNKFAAVLLVLCLALTLFPTAALAEEWPGWEPPTVTRYPVTGGDLQFEEDIGMIVGCDFDVTEAVVPREINGVKVTCFSELAFTSCYKLTSVAIPDTVSDLPFTLFFECTSLTQIWLPDTIAAIGDGTFSGCSSLTDVYYSGTESQWDAIKIEKRNECLTNATIHFNSESPYDPEPAPGPEAVSIAVLSTEKSLTVRTGDEMWLSFGVYIGDGLLKPGWDNMSLEVSNEGVISLSDPEKTDYGYIITVYGLKPGTSVITVTDGDTGMSRDVPITVKDKFVETFSYAIDDMKAFYPESQSGKGIITNIFDLNGLYVNKYKCVKTSEGYNVSFMVYNSQYHTGSVDIYDRDRNWISCEKIDKFQSMTSVVEVVEQGLKLVSDGVSGKLFNYQQASFSRETPISFSVPEGGYFVISNNVAESPGAFLFNACDILFEGAWLLADAGLTVSGDKEIEASDFAGAIKWEVTENESMSKLFADSFEETAGSSIREQFRRAVESGVEIEDMCIDMGTMLQNLLEPMNIKWQDVLKRSAGLKESFVTELMGPVGKALKGCFQLNKILDLAVQLVDVVYSADKPYATVYSSIDNGFINEEGVIIDTGGKVDKDAELHVFQVTGDTAGLPGDAGDYLCYNIGFAKDETLVRPSGMVTVRIWVPYGVDLESCRVYRQDASTGEWLPVDALLQAGYMVFETDSMGVYAIGGRNTELKIISLPDKLEYKPGETLDTSGLVLEMDGERFSQGYVCSPTVFSDPGTVQVTVKYGLVSAVFEVRVSDESGTDTGFDDVSPDDYFYKGVLWAVENGITKGTGKNTFSPMDTCTRAEAVTFLWRAAGSPEPEGSGRRFADVAESAWYRKAVLWAVENKITRGTGANSFSPEDTVTRGQVVAMLYRFMGEPHTEGELPFIDVSRSDYFFESVKWAVQNGVTKGTSATAFSPYDTCIRGQIVTLLHRAVADE